MIDYLSGALSWLQRRNALLLGSLTTTPIPSSLARHIQLQAGVLKSIEQEIGDLLLDPSLSDPGFSDQHLVSFRNLVRQVDTIEALFLPLVERWGSDEEQMQQLAQRICRDGNLPDYVKPVVALYSHAYFYVFEDIG